MELGHWKFSGEVPEDTYGFIYLITNLVTGRKYIGKKQMQSKLKRKPLKGKKRKRVSVVETDWRTYTGSSTDLNADIEKVGKSQFTFDIIRLCSCKWDMAYYEAKYQFDNDVLLREDFYNGIVNLRVGRPPKSLRESK